MAGIVRAFACFGREEFGEGGPVVPAVSRDIRDLIRRMSRENLLWASAAFRMAAVTIRDPERKK